ncbi:hypothetical protein U2G15_003752 [Escherichia coli]|nr:hypothetical protein [Escherichia coli]EFB5423082.1 hypothetical protein [Escherichia coli]EMA2219353.1 hypothetical protein [Escherichia coli]HAO9081676.1 hypothetical protein [Escherichia coli]HAX4853672.1 hypothetical protein [Escherichia coli]HAX4912474.1 hypothetical protein [Escherichia coli]
MTQCPWSKLQHKTHNIAALRIIARCS